MKTHVSSLHHQSNFSTHDSSVGIAVTVGELVGSGVSTMGLSVGISVALVGGGDGINSDGDSVGKRVGNTVFLFFDRRDLLAFVLDLLDFVIREHFDDLP